MLRQMLALACSILLLNATPADAQIGNAFSYQGYMEINNQPYSGTADVLFEAYNAATLGTQLGSDNVTNVLVTKGVFSCVIDGIPAATFSTGPRWMQVWVRVPAGSAGAYTPLLSRQQILPSPYTIRAATSAKMDGIEHVSGNIGIGTTTPASKLHVKNGNIEAENGSVKVSKDGVLRAEILWNAGVPGVHMNSQNDHLRLYTTDSSKHLYLQSEGLLQNNPGNVGIGVPSFDNPQEKLHVNGNVKCNTTKCNTVIINGGSDVAEPYDIAPSGDVEPLPGMVVAIDPAMIGKLRVCDAGYDRAVAGIISGANGVSPGLVLSQTGTVADGEHPVASAGRVWCYVDADAGGAVVPGDLLTSSSTPGHAMKVADAARANGAILGKAMSPLPSGKGFVLVLVSLQ